MNIEYNDTDIIQTEDLKGDLENILQVNRFVNEELIVSAFFENSKKIKQVNFQHPEVSEIIYEYHRNHSVESAFDNMGIILEKTVLINNPFEDRGYDPYFFQSGRDLVLEQNGEEQLFKISDSIMYRFNGSMLEEILFDIEGYNESYHLTAEYDENGKLSRSHKKYLRFEDAPPVIKTYEYFENGFSEKSDDSIAYTLLDEKNRKRRIGTFRYIEDKLELFKQYMITQDPETYSLIMKDIRLETFDYDDFDNEISHEILLYRPDFSKDRLTHYLQEENYFDQYNIEYSDFYCRTREDYDDVIEHTFRLEYLDGKVNKYNGDKLLCTFFIENEKKIKAEFFSPDTYSHTTYDEYGNEIESFFKNNISQETTRIRKEIIYKAK